MKTNINIQHRPFGDYHPYEPSADQRVPTSPNANESVRLGILTEPIGAVEKVSVLYWINDEKDTMFSSEASFLQQTNDNLHIDDEGHLSEAAARAGLIFGVDNWQAEIPEFPAGTQIEYQIVAMSKKEKVDSETFSYQILKTSKLSKICSVYKSEKDLIINLENNQEKKVYIKFDQEINKAIKLEVGFGERIGQKLFEFGKNEILRFSFGNLNVEIQKDPLEILFGTNNIDKKIIKAIEIVEGYASGPQIKITFNSEETENFFGFGERFDSINQRGNMVDVRLFEQYKSQGKMRRTYLPMPLFISSLNYGFILNSQRYSLFDLCHSKEDQWSVQIEISKQNPISMNFVLNESDKLIEITKQITDLTGKSPMLPNWAFGLWISANEWNTQKRVEEVVAKHEELDIPLSVVVIEAWSDEATFYIWNGAKYEPKPGNQKFSYSDFKFDSDGMWYDPKWMVDKLHEKDIHLILWQIPVLKENDEGHSQLANDQKTMLENDYCVKKEDGTPYLIRPFWFRDGLLMDFTNPKARDWWFSKREYLLDEIGIDGFKTDGGEHLWDPNLKFYDGRQGDEMVNAYAQKYVQEYYQFAQSRGAITFSRAGYTGAQTSPCHWAGDENSTWEAFQHTVNAGLNAALSGITFWGFDIGGFSGPQPSSELYLRASAFATFCPIMQYHAEFNHHKDPNNDRTPWQIDFVNQTDYVVPIFKKFTKLRYALMPYILDVAKQSSETGIPMMRPYILDDGDGSEIMQKAYYFGEDLFVIPIVEESITSVEIKLPVGKWFDFWDNSEYQGGKKYTIETPLDRIPVFSKKPNII